MECSLQVVVSGFPFFFLVSCFVFNEVSIF